MPRYAITERAGPFVAGIRNTGVGTVLDLTERQAEHELRLGTLVRLPEPDKSTALELRIEPPLVAPAPTEPSSTEPVIEQDTDAPAPSCKQKRLEAAYLGQRVMVLAVNQGRIHAVHDMRSLKAPDRGLRREQPELVEAMAGLRRELERC